MNRIPRTIELGAVCLGLAFWAGCVVVTRPVGYAPRPPVVVVSPPVENYQVQNLRQRAAQGNPAAQFTLGSCYANGRWVAQNYAEAVNWYYLAARQGYAPAQNRLGVCYACGWGVARNDAMAVTWYRLAAQRGYAQAQDNLGACYFNGRGVPRDPSEAVKWYSLAAAQGNQAAENHLRALGNQNLAVKTPVAASQPPPNPPAAKPDGAAGNPVTMDEIGELSRAGVNAETLISQIKATNSKFSPQDIAAAQQARLDPSVIECMKENLR